MSTLQDLSCIQVRAGDTSVLETVLRCDAERSELLEEEAKLLAVLNPPAPTAAPASTKGKTPTPLPAAPSERADPDAAVKLEKVSTVVKHDQSQ